MTDQSEPKRCLKPQLAVWFFVVCSTIAVGELAVAASGLLAAALWIVGGLLVLAMLSGPPIPAITGFFALIIYVLVRAATVG